MTEATPSISKQLAEIILGIRYEDLPQDVIHETKRRVLDTLACAVGALSSRPVDIVLETIKPLGGNPQSTILGTTDKTSVTLAAFANATMIRYLDFNDYYFYRDPAHASSTLATVFALAEAENLNGKDVITGLVAAYEGQIRLCTYCGEPNLWDRGWRGSATNVSFGATAGAVRLLELDADSAMSAFGMNNSHNSTLAQSNHGTIAMMKATAEATVCKVGLEAALLARHGMTGPPEIFEGKFGWVNVIAGGADYEGLTQPINGHYRIMDVCMKPFAAEMMTQSSVQVAIDLVTEHNFDPTQAEKIEVFYHDYALKKPSWDKSKFAPKTRESADHSFPYCVAVSMLDRACGPEQFTDEKLFDEDVLKIISKITLGVDDELTKVYREMFGTRIRVTMPSGEIFEKTCVYPHGHPQNPLTDEQVEDKFRYLTRHAFNKDQIEAAIAGIWQLDQTNDITAFMRLFASTSS